VPSLIEVSLVARDNASATLDNVRQKLGDPPARGGRCRGQQGLHGLGAVSWPRRIPPPPPGTNIAV
jgi:hypothetical protein